MVDITHNLVSLKLYCETGKGEPFKPDESSG